MARRTVLVALVAVVAVVAASCHAPGFDFDGDDRANYVAVSQIDHSWRDLERPAGDPPLFVGEIYDHVVPADYDGNKRAEAAVVRANGDWVTQGALGTFNFPAPPQLVGYEHGSRQMLPVPADYDGDGKTDPAWYRDTDGTWFIRGRAPVQFGTGPTAIDPRTAVKDNDGIDADIPVPADYDGDHKADLGTYNPRTLLWRTKSSRDGSVSSMTMPGSNATINYPAPGNYDGLGRAQRALLSIDGWRIEGHAQPILFGDNGEPAESGFVGPYPAVADYDGDGITDLSYLGGNGNWRTRSSADPSVITSLNLGGIYYAVPVQFGMNRAVSRIVLLARTCQEDPPHC